MASALERVVALLALGGIGCAPLPAPLPLTGPAAQVGDGERARLVIVGDLQRTSHLELWRESNDPERLLLVQAMVEARPDLVAIVGDLVFDGGSPGHWAAFDEIARPLREARLPVVAALGNHEYWRGKVGERHFFARLPHLDGHRWYVTAVGPLRLVILDSNPRPLGEAAWLEQKRWFERTLEEIDADPAARGALVLVHHPPWTNSTVTGDDRAVQETFVPAFSRARKTLAMVSGHVHSYERFAGAGGKTLLVSGGGGGPRVSLRTGARRRHPDLHDAPAPRPLHFLLVTTSAAGLAVEVRALPKGALDLSSLSTIDRFSLPYAP